MINNLCASGPPAPKSSGEVRVSRMESQSLSPMPDFLLSRLLYAGWLTDYAFIGSRGYYLHWSKQGWPKVLRLRALIQARRLNEWTNAKTFTNQCYGIDPMPSSRESIPDMKLWISALEEVRIGNEEMLLKLFCEMILKTDI